MLFLVSQALLRFKENTPKDKCSTLYFS